MMELLPSGIRCTYEYVILLWRKDRGLTIVNFLLLRLYTPHMLEAKLFLFGQTFVFTDCLIFNSAVSYKK